MIIRSYGFGQDPVCLLAWFAQTEVQALRDKCEELVDDVRALLALVHALRGALVVVGCVNGG
jgi:hypothetical protein